MAAPRALPKNAPRIDARETIAVAASVATSVVSGGSLRKIVLALAGLCCTSWVLAQSAGDAATAERMERAKRDASNPLRMIIEASSVKRAKPADAPPAAAPAAARPPAEPAKAVAERKPSSRADASTAAAEPAARPVAAKPPVAEPVARGAPEAAAPTAAAAPEPPPLAAVPAAAAPEGPPLGTVPSVATQAANPPAAAAATLPAAAPAAALTAPLAATVPVASPPAAEVLAPLKLVRYIEPEIPARIRGRLKPSSEVTVAFKVQPDGSVSDVGIRQTTARALDPIVLDAVRQWRYDPVPAEREHVVQLVFNLAE
jgi:TonB family protein